MLRILGKELDYKENGQNAHGNTDFFRITGFAPGKGGKNIAITPVKFYLNP
ncbi:Uncharacterized [Moorella glycerini]|uniref:Uncharacterized protein n=1 Tax=Neomoorella stamsii TaxID=1266720 RepID=A0A9X7J2Z9_9FIRM|nr:MULTISPECIES: hypothetical protein [Moorella]PRR73451.1 hypothetical protein MOST_12990 [Moorella stamsii]CEP69220.1 Uncharacterized [Moorella glycerini]